MSCRAENYKSESNQLRLSLASEGAARRAMPVAAAGSVARMLGNSCTSPTVIRQGRITLENRNVTGSSGGGGGSVGRGSTSSLLAQQLFQQQERNAQNFDRWKLCRQELTIWLN
jgi:hypothetical protein